MICVTRTFNPTIEFEIRLFNKKLFSDVIVYVTYSSVI